MFDGMRDVLCSSRALHIVYNHETSYWHANYFIFQYVHEKIIHGFILYYHMLLAVLSHSPEPFAILLRGRILNFVIDRGRFLKKRLIFCFCLFQFHQTLKTYLNDHVWDFHFYIPRTWPDQAVILHFPGMTGTVSTAS